MKHFLIKKCVLYIINTNCFIDASRSDALLLWGLIHKLFGDLTEGLRLGSVKVTG